MMGDVLEYALYLAILVGLAVPLSGYICAVMSTEGNLVTRVLSPIERGIYAVFRIDSNEQMTWKKYLLAVLLFTLVSFFGLFLILLFQGYLPFNPEGLPGLSWDLAFNTAASFVSNTNWQAYSGESTLSYFSQAIGLTVQNFATPAVAAAVLFALFRGMLNYGKEGLGSFWKDIVRFTLYVLIPLSLVVSLVVISQGSPQNLSDYQYTDLLETTAVENSSGEQVEVNQMVVPEGPQASQTAIKQLGTNGGGYNGANSASPLENPTALSNLIECISLLLIPVALVFSFGRVVKDRKQGRALFAVMFAILLAGVCTIGFFEQAGTSQLAQNGAVYMGIENQPGGNMEGKEARFGITDSTLWSAFTTAASNGAVNAMHDSYTPIGGMVPMFLMQLGEIVFGGIGCGLYGMFGFVILTVFIAGLMVGRTPEYLGKKIGPREMRMAVILVITTPMIILGGCALLCLDPATFNSLNNSGPHGFSEVLYAATSMGANNGSAFAGLSANTIMINIVGGIQMILNRVIPFAAALCLAGSLCTRQKVAESAGTLSTSNVMFVFLLFVIIFLVAALSMFPALALGPIAEHLQMIM